ncbi:hypothetical protein A4R63_02885 [Corynebacterium pseudotuberculosis]|nr:hypothetical protein ATN03_02885 [Corynebacterium pseudotuberculosis]AMN75372.1 hypothetical protein ATN05_02880 [Corynebacterium pseudotuberculosis]ANZ91520.1 hypothetical protein CPMB20_02880 [Corynebacterium pseudotuberculosis]APB10514.1 hypothetical protein A4R72_03085 [Corynebacterium pseudotuberculosis]APB12561.1 hypothetical protein A4R71_03100 [Corynebacterium pseudotuberculosis]
MRCNEAHRFPWSQGFQCSEDSGMTQAGNNRAGIQSWKFSLLRVASASACVGLGWGFIER